MSNRVRDFRGADRTSGLSSPVISVLLAVAIAAGMAPPAIAQDGAPASDQRVQAPADAARDATEPDTAGVVDDGGQRSLSDLPLEDLLDVKVYAASRFVQDAAQAPASVTIVSADEIRRQGYRTLADILRGVRGFYVTNDRDYSYVGVRGFLRAGDYNGRILLLVNGHRLNDNIYDQALLGTESPIDVALFDRVEVIRGPSSSLYGTSAFFAVVNIVTRDGRAIDGAEMQFDGGSQRLRRGRVAVGGRTRRGFDGLFAISAFDSRGNDRIYFPEFASDVSEGVAVDADRDRAVNLYASGSARGFSGQLGFGSRTKRIPTAAYNTRFNDGRTQTVDRRAFAEVQYTRRLDRRTTLSLRAGYDHFAYDGTFAYDTGLFLDDGRGDWLTGEGAWVRQMDAHTLTVGTEYRYNIRQDQSARNQFGVLLDDRRRSQTAALFVEDQYRLNAHLTLSAGLRWDQYFGLFGGTLNPRVALILSPYRTGTLKLLYGRAFRAPNPFELYYDRNEASAQPQPERIHSTEIAWEQRVLPRLQITAALFRSHVTNLLVQRSGSNTIDGLYFGNGNDATAAGAEVELQGELPGRVHARIAQVWQSPTCDPSGNRISNSPNALTTVVADAPVPGTDAVVAFNGYYIGSRQTIHGGTVGAAFVGNLSVSRRTPVRGLDVGLTLYNVFNEAYGDPGSVEHRQTVIPQDGRTAAVHLLWRF